LKLDTAAFNTCLDGGKYASAVTTDLQEGSRVGVSGTPAFFVNGQMLSGAVPFASFQEIIEDELASR
jgi:protein-disulfide isomerase